MQIKITYAGEYLRIRYPREGYHSKGYLCYYKNGELISEKLIRDEIYKPQKGIVNGRNRNSWRKEWLFQKTRLK